MKRGHDSGRRVPPVVVSPSHLSGFMKHATYHPQELRDSHADVFEYRRHHERDANKTNGCTRDAGGVCA